MICTEGAEGSCNNVFRRKNLGRYRKYMYAKSLELKVLMIQPKNFEKTGNSRCLLLYHPLLADMLIVCIVGIYWCIHDS